MRGDRDIEGGEGLGCTAPQQKRGVTVTIAKQRGSRGQRSMRAEAVLDLNKSVVSRVIYKQGGIRRTEEDWSGSST